MMVRDIAGRFSGNRTFVEELERLVPEFYENVGQHLEAFRPKPPQVKPEKPAAEAVPDASRGLQEVEVAANDAANEALNGLVAGMGTASAPDDVSHSASDTAQAAESKVRSPWADSLSTKQVDS